MFAYMFFCICNLFVTGALISFSLCGIGCFRPNVFCDYPGHTRFYIIIYNSYAKAVRIYL